MKFFYITIIILFGFYYSQAQIVTIPDANFKNALVNFNVIDTTGNGLGDSIADTNGDGEIQVSEAEAIINLIISYYEIVSLEGVQSFINLEVLKSRGNFIETIDLSQNISLTWLHLSTNPLISIDVSDNLNLERLWVYNNDLTNLDVSQNPNLNSLRCYSNNLISLNIANGNNVILSNFIAYENPTLSCIQVDDIDFANSQTEWQIDDSSAYSEVCELGIYDEEIMDYFIYPNPAQSILYIETRGQIIETIKIINLHGIVVKEIESKDRIDISSLASGMYFVSIYSDGNRITKKFMKM